MCLGRGKTDSVGEALAKRASGDLDTIGVVVLGVTRRQRVELTEVFEVIERELVALEVEEDVEENASGPASIRDRSETGSDSRMSIRQSVRSAKERNGEDIPIGKHETITVEPLGVLGVRGDEAASSDDERRSYMRSVLLTGRRERVRRAPCPWEHLLIVSNHPNDREGQ